MGEPSRSTDMRQAIIDELIRAAEACRRCGAAHQWREETYTSRAGREITRATWGHPVDGHTYERTMPADVSDWLRTYAHETKEASRV